MRSSHVARRALLVGSLAILLLSLAMPATSTYAAPILRLRLELAPGTPNPIPAGQPFRVRLTYECSSSIGTDQCLNMQVQSTLPAAFEGLEVIGNNDVTLAGYNPGTRTATWNFRSPLPLGTTGQLEFEVRYTPGTTLDGTTGTITATSSGTGSTPGSGGIIPPPADATPQPSVSKALVTGGASDDVSAYSVNVCAGAAGALDLTNTTIVDTLPPGAVYVGSNPVGAYDSLAGTLTWGPLTVEAPGCQSFLVAVSYPEADPLNQIGALKTNAASVTTTPFGGLAQTLNTSYDHNLSGPNPQLNLQKTATGAEGTADTIIGGVVTTTLTVDNIGTSPDPLLQGNVTISNVQIVDPIPAEQRVFAIDTGAATAVAYQRNGVNTWITGVALGGSVAVNSANFPGLLGGDYISNLRFAFPPLTLLDGERSQAVTVLSTIVNPPNGGGAAYTVTAATPRMVPNTATASAEYKGAPLSDKSSTATIEVAVPKARPDPQKLIASGSPALPEGVVSYELRMRNGAFAPLAEPVIADLLPAAVTYTPGSWALAKNIPGCAAAPTFSQTDDFDGSGRTLLLWSWAGSGCSIPGDEDARITFDVTVNEGTRAGSLPNRLALVDHSTDPTLVRASLCAGGVIPEASILSGGGVGNPARYCFSDPSALTVRAIASIGSAKFVKGQLDTAFSRDPIVGATVQGGLITYQMELENTGNIDLTDLEIVDILPYASPAPGNVGVRDQVALGTAWTVQLAGPVVISPPIPGLVISYSSEVNPCRANLTADPNLSCTPMVDGAVPGPGVWSTQLPSDPTAVRSLRFDFGSYTLLPVQTIRFTFPAFAPVDAPVAGPGIDGDLGNSDDTNVAWNTFAYEATRADDGSTLVAQPPRVGVEVQDPPLGLASYGNYVWHDVDKDGVQNEPAFRGLNGVTVNLYRDADGDLGTTADQTLAGTQITRNDVGGDPGYYLFNALQPGFYFAEFERPAGYTVTGQNDPLATPSSDSDIDSLLLRTIGTELIAGENDPSWDAGFYADTVSLGNRLFFDTNNDGLDNDGDGVTPGSSTGIEDVTVQLFLDEDGNGFLTGDEQNWIAEATTDSTGGYLFTEQTRDRDGTVLVSPVPLFPAQYLVGIPAAGFSGSGPLVGYYSSGTSISATGAISELSAPDPDTGPDGQLGGGDDDLDYDDNGDTISVIAGDPVPNPFAFYDGGVISKPVFVDNNEPTDDDGSPGTAPGGGPIADSNSNLTVDFGFYTAGIGNLVWIDDGSGSGGVRADGIRNGSEPGLAGVTVRLLSSAGVEISVGADGLLGTLDDDNNGTLTGAGGTYAFGRLPEGSYQVRITLPSGYVSTRDTADTAGPSANTDDEDNGVGSDQTATTATSNTFLLDAGDEPDVTTVSGLTDDPTIDFGVVRHYSLGNRVWDDRNNNGLQDAGELGIASVTLRLLQSDGVTSAVRIDGANAPNQTTDASGFYRFDLLPAGDYLVEVLASELTTGGDLVGYRTSTGDLVASGPYEPAPDPDTTVTDQDDNGTLSAGVVRSAIVTLGEGSGTAEPTSELGGGPASPAESPDNQSNRSVDFGFWPTFSLGNRVWDDLDNSGTLNAADGATPGLSGVAVRLYRDSDNNGTPDGAAIATTSTSADGYYLFTDLIADTYIVEVVPPAGYRGSTGDLSAFEPGPDADVSTTDNDDNGTDGAGVIRSAPVTLSLSGEPTGEPATPGLSDTARDNNGNYTVDFGLFLPLSLGNLAWEDANNNGLADGGESGINGLTVRLYRDSDNNGTPDGAAIATTTTSVSGHYLFIDLGADIYIVEVVNPAGMVSSSGQSLPAPYEPAPDPDSDTDDNDNGTRSTGVARSGPVSLTRGGEPAGEPATPGIADTTPDNRANYTVDFGFYTILSLGNRVWSDANNNGLLDGAETGINAVTMWLYRDNDSNGAPDDLNGGGVTTADAIASANTASGGYYLFTNLSAGNYIVEVDSAELTGGGTLATYASSTGLTLPNPYEPAPDPDTIATDSDDNGTLGGGVVRSATVTLSVAGEPIGEPATPGFTDAAPNDNNRNYTVDFGFYRRLSLGNLVWEDTDNSGAVNGAEAGITGVTVRLYRDADNNGTPDDVDGTPGITIADAIASTSTNATGNYLFTGLSASTYIVEVVPPAGYRGSTGDLSAYEPGPDPDTIATDNDDNGTTSGAVLRSAPVTLTDGGEPTGEGATPGIADATTDNRSNVTVDFGLFQPLSLGNLVWEDADNNGLLNGAEAGLTGVTVRLYRDSNNDGTPNGAAILTQLTNGTGHYLFTDLGADTYIVEVVNPAGMVSSSGQSLPAPYEPAPDPDSDTEDNDNGTRGAGVARSAPVTLSVGGEPTDDEAATPGFADSTPDDRTNHTVDFGFYTALSLGNRVWNDANNNGLLDGGESGVDAVPARLYRDNNSDGTPDDLNGDTLFDTSDAIATLSTAGGGYYLFTNLSAGTYLVEIVAPAGYRSSIGAPVAPGPYEPAPDPDATDTDSDDSGSETGPVIRSATVTLSVAGEPTDDEAATPGFADAAADNNANYAVDFGIYNRVSLGDLVFIDNNNNGTFDAGDSPLQGATVALFASDGSTPAVDGDGSPVAPITTLADGLYLFSNLSPGDYVVRVTPPAGYISSGDLATSASPNNDTNHDDNGVGSNVSGPVSSGVATLTSGGEPITDGDASRNSNLSVDFGFYRPVSLGNQVWYDTDNSRRIDGAEAGIAGVRVELFYDASANGTIEDNSGSGGVDETQPIAVDDTAADGTYLFTEHTDAAGAPLTSPRPLNPGTYVVGLPASQLAPAGVLSGLFSSGTSANLAGVRSEITPDDPDAGTMPAIDGDDNGALQTAGFYTGGVLARPVTLTLDGEPTAESPDVDPNPAGRPDASDNQTVDFGFYAMSLGNLVWRDDGSGGGVANDGLRNGGEIAIAGVTVRLIAENGSAVLATATTDAAGRYLFTGLAEGIYLVEVDRTSAPLIGLDSSRDPASAGTPNAQDSDDNGVTVAAATVRSQPVTLDAGAAPAGEPDQALATAPGMGSPPRSDNPATPDANSNLRVDFGFAPADWGDLPDGSAGLPSYSTDRAGTAGPSHTLTTGLGLGAAIDAETDGQPNATADGDDTAGLPDDEDGVTLPAFFTGLPADVTVRVLNSTGRAATLFGFIDFNGDGDFGDASEQLTVAAPNGTSGDLTLSFSVPRDAVFGSALGARFRLSSDIGLGPNGPATDGEVEDYLITITPTYSLGNRVWRDLDNSGAIDAADGAAPGVDGVTVRLRTGVGGAATDATGAAVADQITTGGGYYRFDNLLAGDYLVEVVSGNFSGPGALVGLFSSTGAGQEADPDSDGDRNDNGLDAPVAGAIRSATVTLGEGSGAAEPAGDSDPATNPAAGEAVNNRSNRTVDFGFISPVSLGDLVFHDVANNGSFDGSDTPLAGALVELRDSGGSPVTDIAGAAVGGQTTGADGLYLFENLRPGDYVVRVTPPAGYRSSDDLATSADPDTNVNDDDNGVGDSTTGTVASGAVTLIAGDEPTDDGDADSDSNLSVDFGFYQAVSLGDLVFHDVANNGVYDSATDSPLAGATVALFAGDGSTPATDIAGAPVPDQPTGATGLYLFTNLKPGQYVVRVTPPAGYRSSDDIATSADPNTNINSDDNGIGDSVTTPVASGAVTLSSGDEPTNDGDSDSSSNLSVDFGFYQALSLGDLVFEDGDDDGSFGGSDTPLAGATVALFAGDGSTPASDISGAAVPAQTTGATGLYLFTNLKPGDYVVRVTPPAGAGYRSSSDIASSADPDNNTNSDDNGVGTALGAAASAPTTLSSGDEPTDDGDADVNSNLSVDFGFHRPLSLGNLVWVDTNNNGVVDGGESGLSGVAVRLYRDSAGDGTPDGAAIANATTNGTGHYLFTGLIADTYLVEIVPPAGYLGSTGDFSAYEPGPDVDLDLADDDDNGAASGATVRSAPITLAAGDEPLSEPATPGLPDGTFDTNANYTVDFGLYQPLSLGNLIWEDADNNGLVDGGESGLSGVTVRLYRDSDDDGTPDDLDGTPGVTSADAILSQATNGTGHYLFTDLGADTYIVEVVTPAAMLSSTGQTLPAPYEPAADADTSLADSDDNGSASGTVVRSAPVTLVLGDEPASEPATPGLPDPAADLNANYTVDFGFYTGLSLGNLVWLDTDNSGDRNGAEAGIPGVTVRLYRDSAGDGTPDDLDGTPGVTSADAILEQTTNGTGHYLFTGLSAGTYLAEIVPPAGYRSSTGAAGAFEPAPDADASATDSDDNGTESGAVIRSAPITLAVGDEPASEPATPGLPDATADLSANYTLDFGLFAPLSLGDLVFADVANNGAYDPADDSPLGGATAALFQSDGTTPASDADGAPVAAQTTGADGLYLFTNLRPGQYVVRVTPPAGYRSSDDLATSADPDTDVNDDDNGVGDSTAGPVASGLVTLTYQGEPTDDGDSDTSSNLSVDFGFYRPLSLGDLVFADVVNNGVYDSATDSPLSGATAALFQSDGTTPATDADGAPVADQTTGADGLYLFTDLKPGQYVVRVTPPAGYRSSDDIATSADPDTNVNDDDNGIGDSTTGSVSSGLVTLTSGDEPTDDGDSDTSSNLSVDFGFYQMVSLGDLVFVDVANNGAYDPATDSPLSGATVALFAGDGSTPATDIAGAPVLGQTTGADGLYLFTSLKPGQYVVRVTPPAGYRSSDDIATSATPDTNVNDDDNGIGDSVTTPVASGVVTLSSGDEPTDDGDSDTGSNLSVDFGFYRAVSLGDLVFEDVANNGVFDGADSPLTGAEVTLYFADGTTPATDADGASVAAQTTGADGLYLFTNLKPGRYVVGVTPPAGYRSSDDLAASADPDSDLNDDDNGVGGSATSAVASGVVTLASGAEPTDDGDSDTDSNLSVDFGFFLPAAIGDFVWLDHNRDGAQDGDEPGVPGVPVQLFRSADDSLVDSTTTDSDGRYRFDGLGVGDYYVAFTLPGGYARSPLAGSADPELDSDADLTTGRTVTTTLTVGEEDLSWDAGIFYTASLGDRVWLDRDADGIQDADEVGVPGVTVDLFLADGTPAGTRTTDGDGFYAFTNLAPGDYYLIFTPPAGYERSPQNPAGAPDADSDADPTTGRTATTTIGLGEHDPSWDAGIYQLVRLGNLVWLDVNNSGAVDGGEAGIPGVAVNLYRDADGDGAPDSAAPLLTASTDPSGSYLFEQLTPGGYLVEVELPSGYVTSTGINGAAGGPFEVAPDPDDDQDNDDNGSRAGALLVRSATVTVWSQDEPDAAGDTDDPNGNLSVDFGLFQPAALGSVVWYDTDADGQHQSGDQGVPGVTITLYTSDGQPVRDGAGQPISVVTGDDGYFLFENLIPGSYQVRFSTLPAGYTFTTRDQGDDGSDSDADRDTGLSQVVTLTAGMTNLTIYAGVLPPTAIELLAFSAEVGADGAVLLRWSTGVELRSAGFHLYRSSDGSRAGAVRVTTQLILARGGPMAGADYSWLDTGARPGQTYTYWLQEVEQDGRTNEHGPVITAARPAATTRLFLPLVVR